MPDNKAENEPDAALITAEQSPAKKVSDSRSQMKKLRGDQIGIKQMMVITVMISIVCAVLAAVLRRLPEDQQIKGSLFILLMLFVCLAVLVFFHVRRARIEENAGPSYFVTTAPLTSWFHFFGILSCVAALVMMGLGLVCVTIDNDVLDVFTYWNLVYLFWGLGAFSGKYLISAFLWKTNPKSVDVRENGLVFGAFSFSPWEHIQGFRWNTFTKKLVLLCDGRFIEWKVPENQREPLEQALLKFIPKKKGLS